MQVANRLLEFINRKKPEKQQKMQYKNGEIGTHLTNVEKEKLYDYYTCDYCGKEIIIKDKWENQTGGICDIPSTVTNSKKITLALHNKCVDAVIREFKQKQIEENNYNHIPRID